MRKAQRNVHQSFFQVVVGGRQRARYGHRVEVSVAKDALSPVYFAVILLEKDVYVKLCAIVWHVRKGWCGDKVLPSLQVAIRIGVFIA